MKQDLTRGNVPRALLLFTIPLILSGLLQQMFSWVDAFIVGNVEGEFALAGIGAVVSLSNLFVTTIIGFTSGVSVLTAQRFGTGDVNELGRILSAFTVLLGTLFTGVAVLGIPFTGSLLSTMNTPQNIFSISKSYMEILYVGVPFLAIYNTYSAVLRGLGDSKTPFLAVLVCSVCNAILDLVFVAGMHFGATGAAIATVLSQAAMTVFIIMYAAARYPDLRLQLRGALRHRKLIANGLKFGLPPAVQAGANSAGNVVLQRFMNGFGEQTVAAITTAYRVDSVILLPIVNLGSGIATVVAQNVGAGHFDRVKKALRTGIVMMIAISVGLTWLVLVAGEPLIAMFGLTTDSVAIGGAFFRTIAAFYVIYGVAMALRGYVEGNGDMLFSGVAGIVALGVRVVASYGLQALFGNMIIAYAEALSWVVLLGLYLARFLRIRRELSRQVHHKSRDRLDLN